MQIIKNILRFFFSLFCFSTLFVFGINAGTILMVILGILCLPFNFIKDRVNSIGFISKLSAGSKIVFCIVLFFAGIVLTPVESEDDTIVDAGDIVEEEKDDVEEDKTDEEVEVDKDTEEDKVVEEDKDAETTDKDEETEQEEVKEEVKEEEVKEEEKAPEPEISMSFKNAKRQAELYIRTMPFSYSGLEAQLAFEGYESDAIAYAMENIEVDWNEQCVKKAEAYLSMMAFSRDGLYGQLQFEGFSNEQIEYALAQFNW